MAASAYSILGADGKYVVIEAVTGWNGQISGSQIQQLVTQDFDYYADVTHDYTGDTWPQCTTKESTFGSTRTLQPFQRAKLKAFTRRRERFHARELLFGSGTLLVTQMQAPKAAAYVIIRN